jgi:two-component system CheB/CheR fusion protein
MAALRVLVVDDNADVADSVSLLLRLWCHEPLVARDGPAALAAATAFGPDVVILDIALPRMDGYELGRRLRELPGQQGLTLLAMSGYGAAEYHRRSTEAGFLAHLVKPVHPPELEALLNVLAREKARRPGAP